MTQTTHKKIIVVDDNIESLIAIKNTLKEIIDVYPAPSISKMFDLLEHFMPDMIILDIEMPDVNGYEAAKMLKSNARYRQIPIVFLTAAHSIDDERACFNLGALDYIYKPFTAPLLLQKIKMLLNI